MRHFGVPALALVLTACAASKERDQRIEASSHAARTCIQEQSQAIAPMNVDLETAVQGVMARCQSHIWSVEREMTSKYPGYRAEMEPGLRRIREAHEDAARQFIALHRTRGGASKQ